MSQNSQFLACIMSPSIVVATGPPMMQDIGGRDLRIAFVD